MSSYEYRLPTTMKTQEFSLDQARRKYVLHVFVNKTDISVYKLCPLENLSKHVCHIHQCIYIHTYIHTCETPMNFSIEANPWRGAGRWHRRSVAKKAWLCGVADREIGVSRWRGEERPWYRISHLYRIEICISFAPPIADLSAEGIYISFGESDSAAYLITPPSNYNVDTF